MSKYAEVRLFWTRSPSPDVKKVTAEVTNDGQVTSAEFGPEVESMVITVQALKTVKFKITSTDGEGLSAPSEEYVFTLGDLETPLPATNLGHEILAIHDNEPNPTP